MAMPLTGEPRASVEAASRPRAISEKYSAGPKLEGDVDDRRREEDHDQDADAGADERGEHRHEERCARLALARHRMAVEAGHRRGEATPGTLSRIEVVAPPYCAP